MAIASFTFRPGIGADLPPTFSMSAWVICAKMSYESGSPGHSDVPPAPHLFTSTESAAGYRRGAPCLEPLDADALGGHDRDRVTLAQKVFRGLGRGELEVDPDCDVGPLDGQRAVELVRLRISHHHPRAVGMAAVENGRGREGIGGSSRCTGWLGLPRRTRGPCSRQPPGQQPSPRGALCPERRSPSGSRQAPGWQLPRSRPAAVPRPEPRRGRPAAGAEQPCGHSLLTASCAM